VSTHNDQIYAQLRRLSDDGIGGITGAHLDVPGATKIRRQEVTQLRHRFLMIISPDGLRRLRYRAWQTPTKLGFIAVPGFWSASDIVDFRGGLVLQDV
jgi:hypothetical protein